MDRLIVELSSGLQFVGIVDISSQMFTIMEFDRLFADVRFQTIFCVGQRLKGKLIVFISGVNFFA